MGLGDMAAQALDGFLGGILPGVAPQRLSDEVQQTMREIDHDDYRKAMYILNHHCDRPVGVTAGIDRVAGIWRCVMNGEVRYGIETEDT